MNCPICGEKAFLSKQSLDLFNGLFKLKDNPIYECKNCFEKFATGKMVDLALDMAKEQFNFRRKIISTGGSLAITLPIDLSEFYKMKKGKDVQLIPKSKKELRIIIE